MRNIEQLLSPLAVSLQPSGIRKFFEIVEEMPDAISLGVGEPDFETPWHIRDAGIYSLEKGRTYYTSNKGLLELRHEICGYLARRFDLEYRPSTDVLVTVGGSEAIDLAMRAILSPGDEVLIPEPSFVCYKPCAMLAGGVPVPIVTRAEDNFKLRAKDLWEKITPRTKMLVLPYPNNPTGAIMTRDDLEEIAQVLRDTDIIVLSDEIYAELTYDAKHVSIAALDGMHERTILVSGFSKAFAMTGWRLGYVCGAQPIIDVMLKVHQYAVMCSPTTSQYAAIEAMKCGDNDAEHMANEYNHRRRVVLKSVRDMGMDCFEPQGAFYIFPAIKRTGLSSSEFCNRLLDEQKVAVVPGDAFGESGEGFVRISYAYSMKRLEEALGRIGSFMEQF